MPKKKPKNSDKYVKYVKYYESSLANLKTVKTSLESIIKYKKILQKIKEVACRVNKIIIHTYNFLKIYCLDFYKNSNNKTIPNINKKLIFNIMKTVSGRDISKNNNSLNSTTKLKSKLTKFYDDHYKKLMDPNDKMLSYTNLHQILDREADAIVTNISNHILNHFYDSFNRYVNICCDKDGKELEIDNNEHLTKKQKKQQKQLLRNEIGKIKTDILELEDKADPKYDQIKKDIKNIIKISSKINDKPIIFLMKENPLDWFLPLIKMSIDGENKCRNKLPNDRKNDLFPIINAFPSRKNIQPKYIDFDTYSLILILMDKNKEYYKKNLLKEWKNVWKMFFKMNDKVFRKKGYMFNRRISTDGKGCSVLFIIKRLYKPLSKSFVPKVKKPYNYKPEMYVDDLDDDIKDQILQTKTIVGIDPNKGNLIYATSGDTKIIIKENGKQTHKTTTFRYTQNQRREETKSKKYAKCREKSKKNHKMKCEGITLTVKQIESRLSLLNANSCILENVIKYIKLKNKINSKLFCHYEREIYSKLKWYSYINRQKTDAKMIKNFKRIFGDPKEVVIFFGDWEQKKQMKYKEPTKGKSIRQLFRKYGYAVYLVDEFRTSCISYITGDPLEKFKMKDDPRPWKAGKLERKRVCHGLLRSKIYLNCQMDGIKNDLVNRDFNASMNIRMKGIYALMGLKYLSRTSNPSNNWDDEDDEDIIKNPKKIIINKVYIQAHFIDRAKPL